MPFERQVFISYAHLDNMTVDPNQDGWVTRFHKILSVALSMKLGRQAQIWRDDKLRGNDIFADEIVQQFPKTELLISIVTPRYVQSEWCTREVNEFYKCAQATGGVRVNNKSRIVKVVKTKVSDEKPLPDVMKEALGYTFYEYQGDQEVDLDPAFGQSYAEKLNLKIYLLAADVAQVIDKIEASSTSGTAAPSSADAVKPAVFVADSTIDLHEAREAVMADLQECKYPLYPQTRLPVDLEASFLGELAANLACCKLAVQIFGSGYGLVPEGAELSVPALTNALAVEYSRRFGLKRVIWVPAGVRPSSPKQKDFLDVLMRDPEAQLGAQLVTGGLEELKATIHAELKKIETPAPPPAAEKEPTLEGAKQVFVICNKEDKKQVLPLIQFLNGHGMQARLPLFSGDAATKHQADDDMLAACDAAIIFYGAGNENWKDSVQAEILKSKNSRTSKQPPICYTYLAKGPNPDQPSDADDDKQFLAASKDRTVIDGLAGFSEAALAGFVAGVAGKAAS